MQEDEQALRYLDVEDSYVTPKSDLPPEWVGMKCDYRETVALYVAAKKLGMQRYQSMSRNYLRCMRQLARIKFNKEFQEDSHSVEREDILEEMALMSCGPFQETIEQDTLPARNERRVSWSRFRWWWWYHSSDAKDEKVDFTRLGWRLYSKKKA